MNKFSWYEAKSVEDAVGKVNATSSDILGKPQNGSSVIFKAGGIDLMDLMKEGIVNPSTIVGVKKIPGLDKIEYDKKSGLKIGSTVTLAELVSHDLVKKKYLALHLAVTHAGTPQLRNSATLGGNLAQRTRCWYFRSIDHICYRKGSGTCYAQKGENEFHAVMNNETCASVHSSSVSTALMAFNAKVQITSPNGKSKEVSMEEFFVRPENNSKNETILLAGDLITGVIIPPLKSGTLSYYIKQGARESHDWAIGDVAVVAEMSGGKCKNAEIVLGAAAPVPMKAEAAAKALKGKTIDEGSAQAAGEASMNGATPLAGNSYKVPVFKAIVKRAILKLA
ncbi:MAG: FAD binding domain-containing protein [Cyclobacteriaceae bacterium]|nr:FAD binding domain-containing protein [Cyclobacteriaceae bacterium]